MRRVPVHSIFQLWLVFAFATAFDDPVVGEITPRLNGEGASFVGDTAARSPIDSDSTADGGLSFRPAFWIVSSRNISLAALQAPEKAVASLRVFDVDKTGKVSVADRTKSEELFRSAENLWVVVHGNRMTPDDAIQFMWGFVGIVGGPEQTLVLWSWPSQPMVRGIARDSRLKAVRSANEATLLGTWLGDLQPTGRVVLMGYSFGAKTILRAMTVWADHGGETENPSEQPATTPPCRAVQEIALFLIAPAADPSELAETLRTIQRNQIAVKIFLTVNERDPALKWYRHLFGCHGPDAIGRFFPCSYPDAYSAVQVIDVTPEVGHTHQWQVYFRARSLRAALQHGEDSGEIHRED